MELKRVTPIGGDETAGYDVILNKEYTVKTFIEEVLSNKNEWGHIFVNGCGICKYKHGHLLSEIKGADLDAKVLSVSSCGGWSLMDYDIRVEIK